MTRPGETEGEESMDFSYGDRVRLRAGASDFPLEAIEPGSEGAVVREPGGRAYMNGRLYSVKFDGRDEPVAVHESELEPA